MDANDNDGMSISVNAGPMIEFLLKSILVGVVLLAPLIIAWLSQDTLNHLFGPPFQPVRHYLVIIGLLFLWYIPGSILLLPPVGLASLKMGLWLPWSQSPFC